ncbi:MAG: hypothetical protein HN509_06805 [Halobacteriovoraceae bacterium]|nr:hypothetical protein [Halobacteriovoraceae bacterium]
MKVFKSDFSFSSKMIKALEEPLEDYQTRESLSDMKKYDGLGSKKEPVRLLFLKFLIDRNSHQGLYNMTAILGHRFYIYNDIDKVSEPILCELRNNSDTGNKWTIIILNEEKIELRKALKKKKKADASAAKSKKNRSKKK